MEGFLRLSVIPLLRQKSVSGQGRGDARQIPRLWRMIIQGVTWVRRVFQNGSFFFSNFRSRIRGFGNRNSMKALLLGLGVFAYLSHSRNTEDHFSTVNSRVREGLRTKIATHVESRLNDVFRRGFQGQSGCYPDAQGDSIVADSSFVWVPSGVTSMQAQQKSIKTVPSPGQSQPQLPPPPLRPQFQAEPQLQPSQPQLLPPPQLRLVSLPPPPVSIAPKPTPPLSPPHQTNYIQGINNAVSGKMNVLNGSSNKVQGDLNSALGSHNDIKGGSNRLAGSNMVVQGNLNSVIADGIKESQLY